MLPQPGNGAQASMRRPQRAAANAWRGWCYAWAAPATLAGLVLALLGCASGARARSRDGVLEVAGGSLGAWLRARDCPFVALTLGHVVLAVDARALDACRAHELAHVRQYERLGPLFLPLYAASSLWQALRGRDAYRDNRFEREAREAAAQR